MNESTAQSNSYRGEKERSETVMRLIGHQVLLNSGDSSSVVLPIETQGNKFRIRFASEFQFVPSKFSASIDSIVQVTQLANSYRVEVENAETNTIAYSYEVDSSKSAIVPCGSRNHPKGKYNLLFTVTEEQSSAGLPQTTATNQSSSKSAMFGSIIAAILVLLAIGFYFWKQRSQKRGNSELIKIGKYRFDERNMKLLLKKESIDLTSKEADLIALLHSSVNVTLERDVILKAVWEDEGDYVGRTLDVFISKLRKKFAEDEDVKIVNIRGVGYKMLLSN